MQQLAGNAAELLSLPSESHGHGRGRDLFPLTPSCNEARPLHYDSHLLLPFMIAIYILDLHFRATHNGLVISP